MLRGRVKSINAQEGYGFIENGPGQDIYFKVEDAAEEEIAKGAIVCFEAHVGGKSVVAKNISKLRKLNQTPRQSRRNKSHHSRQQPRHGVVDLSTLPMTQR